MNHSQQTVFPFFRYIMIKDFFFIIQLFSYFIGSFSFDASLRTDALRRQGITGLFLCFHYRQCIQRPGYDHTVFYRNHLFIQPAVILFVILRLVRQCYRQLQ